MSALAWWEHPLSSANGFQAVVQRTLDFVGRLAGFLRRKISKGGRVSQKDSSHATTGELLSECTAGRKTQPGS